MPDLSLEAQPVAEAPESPEAPAELLERREPVDETEVVEARRSVLRPNFWNALGLVVAAIGFLIGSRVISDNSFMTHLATGRYILDQGSVPSVDIYSATAAGEPWVVQSWLPSVIYASLVELVGGQGIRFFNGLLGLATMAIVWRLLRPIPSVIVRLAMAAIPLIIGAELWGPRPLLFGLLGIALILDFLLNERKLYWILPVMWIWVNSHGSFPLAGVLVGAYGIGQWLDNRAFPLRTAHVFAWVSGGTLLGMIGPLGWRGLWFPIQLLANSSALEGVTEWAAPSYKTVSQLMFAGLIIGSIALGARRTTWTFAVPSGVFLLAGLLAIRSISTAALVVVVLAAPLLTDYSGGIAGGSRSLLASAVGFVGVAMLVLVSMMLFIEGSLKLDTYPVDEVAWLEDRGLVATTDVTLVHRDYVGNYLDLRFGSDAAVFVDDRFDMFPADVLADHRNLIRGISIREILDRRGADVLLWESGTPLEGLVLEADDWTIEFETEDWFVACRTTSSAYELCLDS